VKITHPVEGYTGRVTAGNLELFFVDGEAEDTNLPAGSRKALEEAGFKLSAAKGTDGK
jgi:hypothetical protein